ncbi:MAG: hypothetical protein AB7F22_15655 [Reyranella sp.]|uniref:hypothetical protein n=1 Tax=Reyranella sp. TaxID=1929291 RepID=UPI003D1118F5
MTLVLALIVVLALALALWLVSLPRNMPAYTRVTFYIALVVVAALVILLNLPASGYSP